MFKELLFSRDPIDVVSTSSKASLGSFLDHFKEGCLYFNDEYQREYCWTEEQQQMLLDSLIYSGIPIPGISVVYNKNGDPSHYFEVVDGRQRITTLILFFTDKIPYIVSGNDPVFFSQLSRSTRISILRLPIVQSELTTRNGKDVSLKQKIEFFIRVNFSGSLQSNDHKENIQKKLLSL